MKKILGLDLGTTSIGWALVNEAESQDEKSSIIKLGVRVNPLTVDEQTNFEQGKTITTNAARTLKRGMRRNLQRYKLRREHLIDVLRTHHLLGEKDSLCEEGNKSTFQTYRLRAKAAVEEISLSELARVLLMINKKRGYKSSRKANNTEEGQLIDGMSVARQLYDNHWTPGQYVLDLLQHDKKYIPDFYRSDLQQELDTIWNFQQPFYPAILTSEFKEQIKGKSKTATSGVFLGKYKIYTADNKGKDKRLQAYQWRVQALTASLPIEELAFVISEINGQINSSSGYLGAISDRSKELYFKKQTVGQALMRLLDENPNNSLRNRVFYRQDYLDEFETIWEKQASFHPELTDELKHEIRDIIIFYQRPLKSQKGLVSYCELESHPIKITVDGQPKMKTIGCKVCPKSSPLFQEYRIWQRLNDIRVVDKETGEFCYLQPEQKETLFEELTLKDKMKKTEVLKCLYKNYRDFELNFEELDGNQTQASIYRALQNILSMSGNGEYNFSVMPAREIHQLLEKVFDRMGWNKGILHFDSTLPGEKTSRQPMYMLWHLLYSYEGDNSATGNEKLIEKLQSLCGMDKEYARILSAITFPSDYGNLSAKAICRLLPYMKEGNDYAESCLLAGYRHSRRSETKEERENRTYSDRLELLPKNTLRNPVVEKILNQMVNVVNAVIDTYGKPDEVRIEMARELKKSAKERDQLTKAIRNSASEHEKYREILQKEFHIEHVSHNDLVRYKLYLELESNGFKTLYSNTYIPRESLFSKEFDIEHIIPQANLFDDSFSNKTLETRGANLEKSNTTAYDYVSGKYGKEGLEDYKSRVENLFKDKSISKTKYKKLLMSSSEIPDDFINRDLRDSQYIAKKALEMLEGVVKTVVSTTGSVTDRLREDWQLVNVMQELNWDKYDKLGMTETYNDKDGHPVRRITGWTKRNDHRHHAMDALTIAFTKRSFIQYLNNLHARNDKSGIIYGIEQKELHRDSKNKLRFNAPILPLDEFRMQARHHLENILVSIKAKNKVVTRNINRTKKKEGTQTTIQFTPRGQLHNETIYGSMKHYVVHEEKVGAKLTAQVIAKVCNQKYRQALQARLDENGGDAKKAFSGKNSLEKNPLYCDVQQTIPVPLKVKVVDLETIYTIRKEVTPDLKIEKVIDKKIRQRLQQRLDEYGGDAKKAFSNLDENPIWLNKDKGIAVKRVTITGIANAENLHDKKDQYGNLILDAAGNPQPVDFVNTGNNHHVAIYRDDKGVLQEKVVSFYEAVARKNAGLPVVDKEYKMSEGWTFLFTMKQNEYFVFPNEKTGFDPHEIDLMNPQNYETISPNLYRVQKLTSKDYYFRHHLETIIDNEKKLQNITWFRISSLNNMDKIVKVRVNHLGQIVSIGEY